MLKVIYRTATAREVNSDVTNRYLELISILPIHIMRPFQKRFRDSVWTFSDFEFFPTVKAQA